ncbi:hypothetical protein TWF569_000954 [Orbilia oligospora]|nr:hypothetical protein TWF569_000954 [Orbilia oligospora]
MGQLLSTKVVFRRRQSRTQRIVSVHILSPRSLRGPVLQRTWLQAFSSFLCNPYLDQLREWTTIPVAASPIIERMRELHSQAVRHAKLADESKENTTFTKREVDEQVKPSPAKSNSLAASRRAEKYCLLRIQAAEIFDVIFGHVPEKYFSLPDITPARKKFSKALRYGILQGELRGERLRAERDIYKRRVWERDPFDSLTPELIQHIKK